jgi:hypothetical protein
MRAIYGAARARSAPLGALLNSGCDIIDLDDREVTFGFRFPNHAAKASEKANLDALAAILLEVTGAELAVTCRQEENVTDWKAREGASRNPLVRAAQEMGARIITPSDGPLYSGLTADPEDLQ